VATNLLLEGTDLEALLSRAHAEGGTHARIVRAEKVRRGGFMGFFAKEGFEVAVEIPDMPSPSVPTARDPRRGAVGSGDDVFTAVTQVIDQLADENPRPGTRRTPVPGQLAADGLLGMADRVSAAERAAARAVTMNAARRAFAEATGRAAAFDLPGAGEGVPHEPSAEGGVPSTTRPAFTALLDQLRQDAAGTAPMPVDVAPLTENVGSVPGDAGARTGDVPATVTAERVPGPQAELTAGTGDPARPPVPAARTAPDLMAHEDPAPQGRPTPRPAPGPAPEPIPAPTAPVAVPTTAPVAVSVAAPSAVQGQERNPEPPPAEVGRPAADPVHPAAGAPAPAPAPAEYAQPTSPVEPAPRRATASGTGRPGLPTPRRGADDADEQLAASRDDRVAADRRALRALGVPVGWTRRLRGGDRFTAVLAMLERMPEADPDFDVDVIAVVGDPEVVQLEAYRCAVDLPDGNIPRRVVVIPARAGAARQAAIAEADRARPVAVAVETAGYCDAETVRETLNELRAGFVVVVIDARQPIEEAARWVESLGEVHALTVDGAIDVPDPASVLRLDLPVVRLDGIPADRVGWAALLCARLGAAEQFA